MELIALRGYGWSVNDCTGEDMIRFKERMG